MGAVALIVVLAGMVVPIVLLLATVLFDVGVIVWAGYRLWHDRWSRIIGAGAGRGVAVLTPMSGGLHGRPGMPRA
ncbi:MAG: hypothetical protein KGL93_00985 [Gemmatimonadota bacterium]|nr:hypothetical protein [Gemmatimonadota bacterium]HEU4988945.1 hypothetical protein [Gemmatimonadaceae bacterium]